jgi:hypothetical protein
MNTSATIAPPRLREWWAVVKEEKELTGSWPNLFKMLRRLFRGRVGNEIWRSRLTICSKCPIFDGELRRCRGPAVPPRRPIRGAVARWHDEAGITWYEVETDQGWKKAYFIGDNVNTGESSEEIAARHAPLNRRIHDDWNPPAPGCGCYVPFLALTKTPYTSADGKHAGCWGRATMGASFGWE